MFDPHNIMEIRELLRLSQTDFAKKLGISREVVNKMESGKMKVSKRTAARLEKYLGEHPVGPNWGDVNNLSKTSHSSEKRPKSVPFHQHLLAEKNSGSVYLVPLVAIKAQAGYVKGFEQTDFMDGLDQYSLPPGVNPVGAVWRYFEIDGDSMEPTLSPGDVVLATMVPHEDWSDIKNFCVYVVLTSDHLLIKRLFKKSPTEWVLISDNEDVAPQKLLNTEEVRQLWLMRRHIRSKAPVPKEFKITA